ncbi:MAG TPA: TonB family protein [Steroidobacteraceae bacterium]|nr:TonB family protein [Steroidobacteraceae bacterium]
MNVRASESMSEAWIALQGQVINGAFPLQRYLNGSEHTGVFLAESRRHKLPQVAIKLVHAIPARADAQLSRWLTADGLAHPHLVRIFEAGRCQLGGLQYLYAVMEYADQSLAELLDHRALTEEEAREMLAPTLSALAFLHERKYVHGQLKPSNIFAVGDQLKLASDTMRRAGESLDVEKGTSVYDPPEARGGSYWPAGDVWALGVTLCEALTRNRPVGLHDGARPVAFPRDFPAAFREIVARCLSRRPHDRPSIAEIEAWLRGNQLQVAARAATAVSATTDGARGISETAANVAGREEVSPDATRLASAVSPVAKVTDRGAASLDAARVASTGSPSPITTPLNSAAGSSRKAGTIEVSEASFGTASDGASRAAPAPAAPPRSVPATSSAPVAATSPATAGLAPRAATPPADTRALAPAEAAPAAAPTQPSSKSSQPPVMTGTTVQRDAIPPSKRRTVVVTFAAGVALALIWAGAHMLRTHPTASVPPPVIGAGTSLETPTPTASQVSTSAATSAPLIPATGSETRANIDETPSAPEADPSVSSAHEVLPDVPARARQTIRGHVRVSVRVIVDPDGTVFAALVDDAGPSKYFARLALEAAKGWTFEPVSADGQRLVQLRFDFTRDGTTARAVPLK